MVAVSLNATCFSNNTNLKQIVVSNCEVVSITDGTFAALPHLVRLDLSSNLITRFSAETFSGPGNLRELDLSSNQILSFPTDPFREIGNLTKLYIDKNRIVNINKATFHNLVKLKTLSIKYNQIVYIYEDTFSDLHSLQFLDFTGNKVEKIRTKRVFRNLGNLTSLIMSKNPIQHLADDVFSDLKMLEYLDVSRIYTLFVDYTSLQPKILSGLKRLHFIDLSGVDLFILPKNDLSIVFEDQRNSLKQLYLQGCRITNDKLALVKNLKALERLYLPNNDLGYIKRSSLPKLAEEGTLYLENNKITYIEEDAFDGMRNRTVTLGRNPLDCSCMHRGFSRWLRSDKGVVVADRDEVTCGSPISLYGNKVMDYDPVWWQCSEYVPLIALIFIVAFVLTVSLIVLLIYCNWINLNHWTLERRIVRMPSEEDQEPELHTESTSLLNPALCRNSLRQGKTGAFIIHNIYDRPLLDWVNKYVENQLFEHPMKITLQFPAGPEVHPLWKQVKEFSFQVNAFLVLVSDEFLKNHWPEMAEKSGIENIQKCVFVLFGKKNSELPKEMKRLSCPLIEWPETGTRFTTLGRERDQFWKELRLALLGMPL
jgi:Leucine-rich repeat (LRR) protein